MLSKFDEHMEDAVGPIPSAGTLTDDEILAKLKKADELLKEYADITNLVAEELARRKSVAIFGVEDAYVGQLGGIECGIDDVYLSITEEYNDKMDRKSKDDRLEHFNKVIEFEAGWRKKMRENDIDMVGISGFM